MSAIPLSTTNQSLNPKHLDELKASGIKDSIIEANFQSFGGEPALEWLIEHKAAQLGGDAQQYATGKLKRLIDRIESVAEAGGWRSQGYDPLSGGKMAWGCFKPDSPRDEWQKGRGQWHRTGKKIKYEHPQGTPTRAFFPIDPDKPDFWEQVKSKKDIPIVITEGDKKAACAFSYGCATVGLPGVAQWNKPKTRELIPELEIFAVEGRTFLVAFDQDAKRKTRRNVRAEIFKLSAALRRLKCKVKIIEWNPALGKGLDDFIVGAGFDAFYKAYQQAVSYEVFAVRAQSELSFTPDWICPDGVKYLTDGGLTEAIPADAKLMGLKAPKGTGKTEAARVIAHQAIEQEQRVLLLSHRIQLTNALAERVQILSVYEVTSGGREQQEIARAEVDANGMALCVHSCHPESQARFNAEDWTDALIIIDEASQVWRELLNSSTIKKHRISILREMRELLTGALSPENQGRVLLMDADLDDITINAIRGCGNQPDLEPWIGVSNYQGTPYHASIHSCPEQWLIDAELTLDDGKKILVMTDSQKQKGRFSSVALEQRWKRKYPGKRILRVDSDSLSLKGHPAFGCVDKANEVFGQYDIVICSPSVETGVSLDLKGHFDYVYGCYQGVLSENSVRQSLARLREPVERVVYVAPRGLEVIGGGETWWQALQSSQNKKVAESLHRIYDASRDDLTTDFLPSQTEAWARYAARHNAGLACYRDVTMARLRDEGHTVIEEVYPDDEETKAEVQGIREETKIERHDRLVVHGSAVIDAEDISDNSYEKLSEQRSLDDEAQALQMERKGIKNRYAIEPTLDLYMLHEYAWFPKIRLHYYLTLGREHLQTRDKKKIAELLENADELWVPDVAKTSLSLQIACLEWLGITDVLKLADIETPANLDTDFISNVSPLAIEIAEKCRANAKAVRLALGISLTQQKTPVMIVRNIIEKLGYRFGSAKKAGPKGEQVRYYPVEKVDQKSFKFGSGDASYQIDYACDRNEVFAAWLERDSKATVEATTLTVRDPEPVGTENLVGTTGNKELSSTPQVPTESTPIAPSNQQGKSGADAETGRASELNCLVAQMNTVRTYTGWQLCWINHGPLMADPKSLGAAWAMLSEEQQIRIHRIIDESAQVNLETTEPLAQDTDTEGDSADTLTDAQSDPPTPPPIEIGAEVEYTYHDCPEREIKEVVKNKEHPSKGAKGCVISAEWVDFTEELGVAIWVFDIEVDGVI